MLSGLYVKQGEITVYQEQWDNNRDLALGKPESTMDAELILICSMKTSYEEDTLL